MKKIRADLHVHTVLSPCAEVEMIPPLIVQKALELNIDLIAITDHNSTGNIRAVIEAAQGTDLTVLPGMELQTREEVHLLCLFETIEQAETWQKVVDSTLPDRSNNPDFFWRAIYCGCQRRFYSPRGTAADCLCGDWAG